MRKFIIITIMILTLGTLSGCLRQPKYDPINDVLDTLTVRTQTAESFDLVVLKDNVELTWTSNSTSIKIEDTTAVVTQGKEDTSVTLKVVASKGELTGEKTFEVKVLKDVNFPTTTTIRDSYTAESYTYIKYTTATVLESSNVGTYFTDGSDVIFADIKNLEKNSTYEVVGRKIIEDIPMLDNVAVTPISSTPKTLEPTNGEIDSTNNGYYKMKGKLNYYGDKLMINSFEIISSNLQSLKLFHFKEVTLNVFVYGRDKLITFATEADLNLSNNEILEVVSKELKVQEYTKTNIELKTNFLFGSTISWTSNNNAISNTGSVTRGNANEIVTLTANITYNGIFVIKEFEVVVIEESNNYIDDLFISEYYESSSVKYIEIYNPTNLIIDLSDYYLKTATNEKLFNNTIQLEGELNPGETIIITQKTVAEELLATLIATETKFINDGIINFNGDDAIGLFKEENLLDIFGIEGGNNMLDIPNGKSEDCRIVRNKYTGASNVFNANEWLATSNEGGNVFDNIGKHLFV